jgi:cell pole-organizing protein PopZ
MDKKENMSNADKNPSMEEILSQIRSILTDNEVKMEKSNKMASKTADIAPKKEGKSVSKVSSSASAPRPKMVTRSESILAQIPDSYEEEASETTDESSAHIGVLSRFDIKEELAFDAGAQNFPSSSFAQSQEIIKKTEHLKDTPADDVIALDESMIYVPEKLIDDAVLEYVSDSMSKELAKSLMITYLQPKIKNWFSQNLSYYLKDIKFKKN